VEAQTRDAQRILRLGTNEPDMTRSPFRWFTADEVAGARGPVAAALKAYDDALRPAGRALVQTIVAMLSAAFPPAKGTDGDAALKLEVYAIGLADFPADMLAESARAALKRCRFFPTVAELLGSDEADALEGRLFRRFKNRNYLAHLLGQPAVTCPHLGRYPGGSTYAAAYNVFGDDDYGRGDDGLGSR
jgi:hypothetical protein